MDDTAHAEPTDDGQRAPELEDTASVEPAAAPRVAHGSEQRTADRSVDAGADRLAAVAEAQTADSGLDDIAASGEGGLARTAVGDSSPAAAAVRRGGGPFPPGCNIDRFVIVEKLGEGGMGVVLAAHDPELDRKVAIKVLRRETWGQGAATAGRQRLQREAQAMARLAHPNVVSVFDVGEVGGQLYVAMEYVDGSTLTKWLQTKTRGWREIVGAFNQAGAGLVAAHAAGLVHRDFKPDNVLVSNDGRVRVTDFGLVGITGAPEATPGDREGGSGGSLELLTQAGAVMGTPLYMAPEQHAGTAADERTDQFAFCVALYSALYGKQPFEGRDYGELAKNVRAGKLTAPPKGAGVPQWVEAIVTRGLQVDPADRFESMDTLLRALGDDPAVGRRRVLLAAGVVVLAGVAAFGILRSRHGPALCTGAESELVTVWNDGARARVNDALRSVERPYAPEVAQRVERLLDRYAADWIAMRTESCTATRIDGTESPQLMDARMRCLDRRLREMQALVSELESSHSPELAERAVEAVSGLRPISDCGDREVLSAVVPLPVNPEARRGIDEVTARLDRARAMRLAGDYAAGRELATAIAADARALDYAPLAAEALFVQAQITGLAGDHEAAVPLLRDVIPLAARAGDDLLVVAAWAELIGTLGIDLQRHEEAASLELPATAALARTGDNPRESARLLQAIAGGYYRTAGYDRASELWAEALALIERDSGPRSLEAASVLLNLAAVELAKGGFDEGLRLARRCLDIRVEQLGEHHPRTGAAHSTVGVAYEKLGRYREALDHGTRALAVKVSTLPEHHPSIGNGHTSLANLAQALGDEQAILEHTERALAIYRVAFGDDHPSTANALRILGKYYQRHGEWARARERFAEARGIFVAKLGPDHPYTALTTADLGDVLRGEGKLDEAKTRYRESITLLSAKLGPEHKSIATMTTKLASVERETGDYRSALRNYRSAVRIMEASLGEDHPSLAAPLGGMGATYLALEQPRLAIAPLERAVALRSGADADPIQLADMELALARALWSKPESRGRAVELATRARQRYEAGGDAFMADIQKVDAWLASRRRMPK